MLNRPGKDEPVSTEMVISGIYAWLKPNMTKINAKRKQWNSWYNKAGKKNSRFWKKKFKKKNSEPFSVKDESKFLSTELRVLALHRFKESKQETIK